MRNWIRNHPLPALLMALLVAVLMFAGGCAVGVNVRAAAQTPAATEPGQNTPAASDQPARPAERMLSEKEIRARYRTCPDGYYSGPQPGKARYTKDSYLWVVTPEFARRFCMPQEFVDENLKGAEAIAYRPVEQPTQYCGWGGHKEVCGNRLMHGFEIYYDKNLPMPYVSDTKFSYRALYMIDYSKHLISANGGLPIDWYPQSPGAQNKFPVSGFGLVGVRKDKIEWPITSLNQHLFFEDVLPGMSLIKLAGGTGGFDNPRMERRGIEKFVIIVRQPTDKDKSSGRPLSDYAHVIEMPDWFVDKIRTVDQQGGAQWESLARRALER